MPGKKTDYAAFGVVAVFAVVLLWCGPVLHPIEEANSAERDQYVLKAEQIRQGWLPHDTFRPLLYPLLVAAAGEGWGDTFAGARLVSQLSTVLFVLLTYLLGRSCFGPKVGLFALLCVVTNYQVIRFGHHAATDMLFAALTLGVVTQCLRVNARPGRSPVLGLAFWFALGAFTRYTAVALAPAIVLALVAVPGGTAKQGFRRVAVFGVAAAVFLLPHFVLTTAQFGNPFYNQNLQRLASYVYGARTGTPEDKDLSAKQMFAKISGRPLAFADPARRTAVELVEKRFRGLMGNRHQLQGVLFSSLFVFGLVSVCFRTNRRLAILLTFMVAYLLMCIFSQKVFYRLLLPVVPVAYLLAGELIIASAFRDRFHVARRSLPQYLPVAVLLVVLHGGTLPAALRHFVDNHPVREVEAAVRLQEAHGTDIRVLGTFPHIGRHVDYTFFPLDRTRGDEEDHPEAYLDRMRDIVEETSAEFLIVGRLTLRERPRVLLTNRGVPAYLELEWNHPDVRVYRIVRERLPPG